MARPKQAPRSKCLNPLDSPAGTRLEDTRREIDGCGHSNTKPVGRYQGGGQTYWRRGKMNLRTCKILCSKQK